MPDLVTILILQQQLAAVQAQIASGLESASYDGKNVSMRSLNDLYKIRDDLLTQIGTKPRTRRTVVGYSGGF